MLENYVFRQKTERGSPAWSAVALHSVLVDTAEHPDEIDVRRAKEAKERAKEQLRQEQSIREYHMSKASLARAMSRLRYSSKDDMRI